MIIKTLIFSVLFFSFNSLALDLRPIDYKSKCGEDYVFCQNPEWNMEIECLIAAVRFRKLSEVCKSEVNFIKAVRSEIEKECREHITTSCKEHEFFTPSGVNCLKSSKITSTCRTLLVLNFK